MSRFKHLNIRMKTILSLFFLLFASQSMCVTYLVLRLTSVGVRNVSTDQNATDRNQTAPITTAQNATP